jgi:hypothetical protein
MRATFLVTILVVLARAQVIPPRPPPPPPPVGVPDTPPQPIAQTGEGVIEGIVKRTDNGAETGKATVLLEGSRMEATSERPLMEPSIS